MPGSLLVSALVKAVNLGPWNSGTFLEVAQSDFFLNWENESMAGAGRQEFQGALPKNIPFYLPLFVAFRYNFFVCSRTVGAPSPNP